MAKVTNYVLPGGIKRFSKAQMYKAKGLYKIKAGVKKAAKPTTKTVPFGKESRTIPVKKSVRWPAPDFE